LKTSTAEGENVVVWLKALEAASFSTGALLAAMTAPGSRTRPATSTQTPAATIGAAPPATSRRAAFFAVLAHGMRRKATRV